MKPIWQQSAADRLDRLLSEAGLRNVDISRAMVSAGFKADQSMVSRWRSGERVPDADQLYGLLRLCGGSADVVLGISGHVGAENAQLREALKLVESAATRVLGAQGSRRGKRGQAP